MKIVLDTNVLLISVSGKSMYHPIFKAILDEKINVCVTTDIVFEYEEILRKHMGIKATESVLRVIEDAPNIRWITKYYKWNLISVDVDDNKFTDCAIAGDVNYLVTDDKHFDILRSIEFPKVNTISAKDFLELIKKIK